MICTNCIEENKTVFELIPEKKINCCDKCSVTYGKNRNGIAFILGEEVMIRNYHEKTDNRIFLLKAIFINEECESGRMCYLVDKETSKPLKSLLDINWLLKL
jgi:hypothetical protein